MERIKSILKFEWMTKKFLIRSLVILVMIAFILRLLEMSNISDNLLLGLMLHSVSLVGLNVWDKRSKE